MVETFKNPLLHNLKFYDLETWPFLKLVMQHFALKLYKVYLNDDPGLTLIYFTAMSNLVAHAFEWGKTVTKSFNGKNLQQMTKLTEDR